MLDKVKFIHSVRVGGQDDITFGTADKYDMTIDYDAGVVLVRNKKLTEQVSSVPMSNIAYFTELPVEAPPPAKKAKGGPNG
jgi:hypothetical protein